MQESSAIEATVTEILRRRVPEGIEVSAQSKITRDLGLDSIAVMDFVMDLEDRFDISIPLDRVAEVETVQDLSAAIAMLVGARK